MVPGFPCTKHFFNSVTLLKYLIRYHLTLEKVFTQLGLVAICTCIIYFHYISPLKDRLIPAEFRFCIELIIDSY